MKFLAELFLLFALTLAPQGATAQRSSNLSTSNSTSIYVVAHADDWQIFMGDRVLSDINQGRKVLFIQITAGVPEWENWELGNRLSIQAAADGKYSGDPVDDCKTITMVPDTLKDRCENSSVNGHQIRRCSYKNTVSYFLRLPGSFDPGSHPYDPALGDSIPLQTPNITLRLFQKGQAAPLVAVDNASAEYQSIDDLTATVKAIVTNESGSERGVMHAQDPDSAMNPHDHSDHLVSGCVGSEVASELNLERHLFVDYDSENRPANLPGTESTEKCRAFKQFISLSKIDYGAEYGRWLQRTFERVDQPVTPADNLFLYDPYRSVGRIQDLSSDCERVYRGWSADWKLSTTGHFTDGSEEIFLYDSRNGRATLVIPGSQYREVSFENLRKSWTAITKIPPRDGKHDLILFYDRGRGEAEIWQFNLDGTSNLIQSINGLRNSWKFILAGHFSTEYQQPGGIELLFYDSDARQAELRHLDASTFSMIRLFDGWRGSWTSGVSGDFAGDNRTDIVLYDQNNGQGARLVSLPDGTFKESDYEWRKSWSIVTPVQYGPGKLKLLFVDYGRSDMEVRELADEQFSVLAGGKVWPGRWTLGGYLPRHYDSPEKASASQTTR